MLDYDTIELYYDFYGALLTERQQEVMELWLKEDYSLSEISDHTGSSRQAVHDLIKRSTDKLYECEKKLSEVEEYLKKRSLLEELKTEIAPLKESHEKLYQKLMDTIEKLEH
ncbi:YlxM family DNA-binding protein [Guggenheimella bovis]